MNYSSFCDYLLAALLRQLEPKTSITKETIRKNNNVPLDAFLIRFPESASSPVVYLEPLYQNYKDGSSIDQIARLVAAQLTADLPISLELLRSTNSLEQARDKIAFRLVSREANTALLSDIPWVPFLDLAVIFYLSFGVRDNTQITTVIHNHQAKSWNLSPQDLYELAKENTPRLFPSTIGRLEHIIFGWDDDGDFIESSNSMAPILYVLSNETGINGASCMLYENTIKDFADKLGEDLIILPSSIHEVLIMTDNHTHNYERLREIVQLANTEEVPKEEILSDQVYLYRRSDNSIIRWTPCDSDNADTYEIQNQ